MTSSSFTSGSQSAAGRIADPQRHRVERPVTRRKIWKQACGRSSAFRQGDLCEFQRWKDTDLLVVGLMFRGIRRTEYHEGIALFRDDLGKIIGVTR
jgi:hypothetical protein